MESLRIEMVSDWYAPRIGGVETSICELSRALARAGHEVFVVTNNGPRGSSLELSSEGVYVYRIKSIVNVRGVTADPLAVTKMALFGKRNAVDVIHAHGVTSTLSFMSAMISSGGTGIPSVLTHHSIIARSLPRPLRLLLRYVLKWPWVLTAVSRAAAEDLRELSGRDVLVTHNCIDVRRWRELGSGGELEGEPSIVFVGRVTDRKNPLEIVSIARGIAKRLPKAKIYVVGDGELVRALASEVSSSGLADRVIMLGRRPRADVAKIMSASDFLVTTGRNEAFGLAVLEAMSLGVVPVIYDSPGVRDLVIDGLNGRLAKGADEVAEAIAALWEDPGAYKALSAAAIATSEKFDCGAVKDVYLSAYKRAIDGCEELDRRSLVYRAYRALVGDPVRRGEWCHGKKWYYHERAREGIVPVIRRRA